MGHAPHLSANDELIIGRMSKEIASEAFGVAQADINGRSRTAEVSFARQVAMYLAHIVGQLTLMQVAYAFDRDRTTVSHACNNVEDRRDGPMFDMQLNYLEQRLRERIDQATKDGVLGARAPKVMGDERAQSA